jgi:hypothetical protein
VVAIKLCFRDRGHGVTTRVEIAVGVDEEVVLRSEIRPLRDEAVAMVVITLTSNS